MGAHALTDMYALSPWTCGPQASGIYIRQSTRAYVNDVIYSIRQNFRGFRGFVAMPDVKALQVKLICLLMYLLNYPYRTRTSIRWESIL